MAERGVTEIPKSIKLDELVRSPAFQQKVTEERAKGFVLGPNGNVVWRFRGETDDRNAARAVANVQLVLLARIEGLAQSFDQSGSLREDADPKAATDLIAQSLTTEKFNSFVPGTATNSTSAPIFEGSKRTLIIRTLAAWSFHVPDQDIKIRQYPVRPDRVRTRWTEQRVLDEARVFLEEQGGITQNLLRAHARIDLSMAVSKYVQGGFPMLRNKLGIPALRAPNGYWTTETIKAAAQNFLDKHGDIDIPLLKAGGEGAIIGAVVLRYPDGMFGLRRDLGLVERVKPRHYWSLEKIRETAAQVSQEYGKVNFSLLVSLGMGGLAATIKNDYPGGFKALKKEMSVEPSKVSTDEVFGEFFEEQGT